VKEERKRNLCPSDSATATAQTSPILSDIPAFPNILLILLHPKKIQMEKKKLVLVH